MKKRVVGGVAVVAVALGIWLSNLFNGLGPGGAGTNVGMNPDVAVSVDNAVVSGGGMTDADRGGTTETSSVGVVTSGRPIVVIDENQYTLEQRTGDTVEYVPTTIEQIVERAKSAEPDTDGILVQIKRRGSSRPAAETALDKALADVGLTAEQIQRHAGFVE